MKNLAGKIVVTVGCVYELSALWSSLPTVSHLCAEGVRHMAWRQRLLTWAFIGALSFHLAGLERPVRRWLSRRIAP